MIMPLTGMTLEQVLWMLPAAIAYQFQLVWLQMQGRDLVIDKDSTQLLVRLKKARGATRG
jgi:hypothetical protein